MALTYIRNLNDRIFLMQMILQHLFKKKKKTNYAFNLSKLVEHKLNSLFLSSLHGCSWGRGLRRLMLIRRAHPWVHSCSWWRGLRGLRGLRRLWGFRRTHCWPPWGAPFISSETGRQIWRSFIRNLSLSTMKEMY